MTATDTPQITPFPVGSLVAVRGREWVVQTGSTAELLRLKPIAGADDDLTGVMPALETVEPARFPPPTLDDLGTSFDAKLLRDAFRVGVTDGAGPFRGFGRIAVEPRPYQLVPLLMALRLLGAPDDDAYPSVRMLVADDVGVGKTIESLLVANELLTTAEADGLAVVCPPHLADQWVSELRDKFHLDATKVGSSTVRRLERGLARGESLFDRHRITVVSLDWIKSRRRRDEFAQAAPNLVVVDEAHLCARDDESTSRHLRHDLLVALAAEPQRHLVLVTATPHSGKEGAFRSLIGLLHPQLGRVDAELDLKAEDRELLARHFVARKRIDVAKYLGDTHFPDRLDLTDEHGQWHTSPEMQAVVEDVKSWARARLDAAAQTGARDERVRWWSVLGLFRALASSPAAATATLRKRAGVAELDDDATRDDVDDVGYEQVADPDLDSETAEDVEAGSQVDEADRKALTAFADRVESLSGPKHDPKLRAAHAIAKNLVDAGHAPIFFCRFIGTAEYVAEHLSAAMKDVIVVAVTGNTPPELRAEDVTALGEHPRRVLVATDCLSEGINLQERFSAVIHYDLPWNPTRLEQREGRVDRYGQPSPEVRVASMQGDEHTIDPLIRRVLIDKHHQIRRRLGFSIPVPGISAELIEVASKEFILGSDQLMLSLEDAATEAWTRWEADTERELEWVEQEGDVQSRAKYAQQTINPTRVADMVADVRHALGDAVDTARFVASAIRTLGGTVTGDPEAAADPARPEATLRLGLEPLPGLVRDDLTVALRMADTRPEQVTVRFATPAPVVPVTQAWASLSRTHPFVAELARHVSDTSLDRHVPDDDRPAARLAVVATAAVDTRTWVATVRFRHDLEIERRTRADDGTYRVDTHPHLVEDVAVIAIEGRDLIDDPERLQGLLDATATSNLPAVDVADNATQTLERLNGSWQPVLDDAALARAQALEEQHATARQSVRGGRGMGRATASPHPNPDVLSVTCLLPDHRTTDEGTR